MTKENIAQFLAIFVFALWERWLGKTDKIKSNSTVELVENSVKNITNKVKGSKEE